MTDALLGLDIGTTACKGLLLAPDGAVLAEASTPSASAGGSVKAKPALHLLQR